MTKRLLLSALLICFTIAGCKDEPQPQPEQKKDPVKPDTTAVDVRHPFGWAICKSLTDTTFNLCGGAEGKLETTLQSTGQPMDKAISDAVKNYDRITFDGSAGPFIVGNTVKLEKLKNKTISGINNAEIRSVFELPSKVRQALDSAGVKKLDNKDGTYTLSNGQVVKELIEFTTRQILLNYIGDNSESYREKGIFYFNDSNNIIIRDIAFSGPGAIDIGGRDLIRLNQGNTNFWIDSCSFTDGAKGHINISNQSSFVTISHCTFRHSEKAYNHAFSILIGGSYRADDAGLLDVTLAYNSWEPGCIMRTPMVRSGHVHVYNCRYDCPGAGGSINARDSSHMLIENNWWSKDSPKTFSADKASAYTLRGNVSEAGVPFSSNLGPEETVPYSYTLKNPGTISTSARTNKL